MLLEILKNRLRISDDFEDLILQDIIEQGKGEIKALVGVDVDYETNASARALLLDYCRYAYNNALEYFEDNFQKEITRLQLQEAVKENDKKQEENNVGDKPNT